MDKTKKEQLAELEQYAKPYASEDCPVCKGSGIFGFKEDEGRYIHCPCVLENIKKYVKELKEDKRYESIMLEDL